MIVGGGDGLGAEIVREVFRKGALVTIVGKDEAKLKAIRDELDNKRQGNPLIRYVNRDITTMESPEVERLIKKAEKYFGAVEMLIFCPALSEPVMFLSSDLDKFRNHMDLTFFCAVKFVIPVSKRMVLRKTKGRICLIGDSSATQRTVPGMTPYACSKAALE
jgi:short-subunit dehydrogenase